MYLTHIVQEISLDGFFHAAHIVPPGEIEQIKGFCRTRGQMPRKRTEMRIQDFHRKD
jgi:hypothetical protein